MTREEQLNYLKNLAENDSVKFSLESIKGFFFESITEIALRYRDKENERIERIPDILTNTKSELERFIAPREILLNKENNPIVDNYFIDINGGYVLGRLDNPEKWIASVNLSALDWIRKAEHNGIDVQKERAILENQKYDNSLKFIMDLKDNYETVFSLSSDIRDYAVRNSGKEGSSRFKHLVEQLKNKIPELLSSNIFDIDAVKFHLSVFYRITNTVLKDVVEPIKNKIKEANPSVVNTMADDLAPMLSKKDIERTSISNFLVDKLEDNFKFKIETSPICRYPFIAQCKDDSFLLKDRKGNIETYSNSIDVAKILINDIFPDFVRFKLRKKPQMAEHYALKLKNEEPTNITGAFIAIDSYIKYENIIKANNLKVENSESCFEAIDDQIHATVKNHKIKQYATSISSNKYHALYNEKSYKLFEKLYDMKIEKETIQKFIGKKLAACQTSDDLNMLIEGCINNINGFHYDAIYEKCNRFGADIVINEDNMIVAKIKTFDQSENLGSTSWCISRQRHYFESYTKGNNNQYFIFDFNKDSSDNNSMIGITLESDGLFNAAHKKDDSSIRSSEIEDMHLKLIEKDRISYEDKLNTRIEEKLADKKELMKNNLKKIMP